MTDTFAALIYKHLGLKVETSPDEYYDALDLCQAVHDNAQSQPAPLPPAN